jgi:curved DNA-binding protein CbpA
MLDHFATLGLPHSASMDGALVRERFHELSRAAHPDMVDGDEEAFAAINEAQRVLSSPAARLRHLLELEFGGAPQSTGSMSAELMDLFVQVGAALNQADPVITKRRAATSALARALLAGEEMAAQQVLAAAGGQIMSRRSTLEAGLGGIELGDREGLTAAWHELSFLEKWQRQVQERMAGLI